MRYTTTNTGSLQGSQNGRMEKREVYLELRVRAGAKLSQEKKMSSQDWEATIQGAHENSLILHCA